MLDMPHKSKSAVPVPVDDGGADHLVGMAMPAISLASTRGVDVPVDHVPVGFERIVLYAYPMTGRPGVALPRGWDDIPGARGCTPESCGFRDHAADLAGLGAVVAGVSTQTSAYQAEAAERLRLPFGLLSDANLELQDALDLPTFHADLPDEMRGQETSILLRRCTLIIAGGVIEHVFCPVFPPESHALQVVAWLRGHR